MMQSRHYEPLPSPSSALKAMAAILTRQAKVDKPRLRNWPDLNRTHDRQASGQQEAEAIANAQKPAPFYEWMKHGINERA